METSQIIGSHYQGFNTPSQNIVTTAWIGSDCSDICFINTTPLTVTANGFIDVDNLRLNPGDFVVYGADNGQLNESNYLVNFGSAATGCTVLRKKYTTK
ncbi:MAG: hypothetical protein ACREOZ_02600 [Gloeomargaritales cyanobacterium]